MKKSIALTFLWIALINGFLMAQFIRQDDKSDYPTNNPLFRVSDGTNKMGFVDKKGSLVIPCQFDLAQSFRGDSAFVRNNKTEKWGIIDKSGTLVMPYQFDVPFDWNNDCFKYAFREKHHDCIFEKEDFGIARMNLNWGIINRQGKWLVPPQYNYGRDGFIFKNGYAAVIKDRKMGLINRKGELILPFIYAYLGIFNNGLINVGINSNNFWTGFVNLKNELVIPLIYKDVSHFEGGFAYASKRVKNAPLHDSLITVTNKIPNPYYGIIDSVDRYGIIDTTGKVIIPFQYGRVMFANDGLFAVEEGKTDGKWGFINTQNQIIIPFQFDMMVNRFYDGVAIVVKIINGEQKFFSIDKTGKCVKDCP